MTSGVVSLQKTEEQIGQKLPLNQKVRIKKTKDAIKCCSIYPDLTLFRAQWLFVPGLLLQKPDNSEKIESRSVLLANN